MDINWQQLAMPPDILGNTLWEATAWAQMDWNSGLINYSEFLYNLDDIFECIAEGCDG